MKEFLSLNTVLFILKSLNWCYIHAGVTKYLNKHNIKNCNIIEVGNLYTMKTVLQTCMNHVLINNKCITRCKKKDKWDQNYIKLINCHFNIYIRNINCFVYPAVFLYTPYQSPVNKGFLMSICLSVCLPTLCPSHFQFPDDKWRISF